MGKFSSPLQVGCRFTSGFGRRWGTLHAGTDYGPPRPGQTGVPVRAVHGGTILATGYGYGRANDRIPYHSGRYVWQDIGTHGGDRMRIFYGHLANITVKSGQRVVAGQIIGYMGGSGASGENHFAIHLHLGVSVNHNKPINAWTARTNAGWTDPVRWLRSKGITVGSTAPRKPGTTTAASNTSGGTTPTSGVVYTNRRNATIMRGTGKNAKQHAHQPTAQNYKLRVTGTKGKNKSWLRIAWKGGTAWIKAAHVSSKKTPTLMYTTQAGVEMFANRGANKRRVDVLHGKGYAVVLIERAGSWARIRAKKKTAWVPWAHLTYTK